MKFYSLHANGGRTFNPDSFNPFPEGRVYNMMFAL